MKFWKKIKERIYRISPTYRLLRKFIFNVSNELEHQKREALILKKVNKEILNKIETLTHSNEIQMLDLIFENLKSDNDLHRYLGQKIITYGQEQIIANLAHFISDRKFFIVDIGASDGWFYNIISKNPNIKQCFILWFEPLNGHEEQLINLREKVNNFDFKKIALSNKKGIEKINEISELRGLSSLAKIQEDYRYFDGNINQSIVSKYDVNVSTLDDEIFNSKYFDQYQFIAIKIDVQGLEIKVLEGAKKLIKSGKVKAILIEMTTIEKYEQGGTYKEIDDFLNRNSFVLYDLLPFYREVDYKFQPTHIGRMTEYDALYIYHENN